ncbi:hypothetical protein HPP92_029119 [Vanilla planifolia]|uniref:Uncharacterized protein n=1 Tax=Vanilla planifolia TaxID=51239 RepID=A0A835U2Z6_VANPL|nr:hypothetical protein HPP92_029119 [Vanilla planifolia]KAG0445892.1 hypothetical protein HPP92_029107 [Vanilla planifolia]
MRAIKIGREPLEAEVGTWKRKTEPRRKMQRKEEAQLNVFIFTGLKEVGIES